MSVELLPAVLRCRTSLSSEMCYLAERAMSQIMKRAELRNFIHDESTVPQSSIFNVLMSPSQPSPPQNDNTTPTSQRDVKEPDGSSARNIFTIRSRVDPDSVLTKNQRLSVYLFSMMYSWLRSGRLQLSAPPVAEDKKEEEYEGLPSSDDSEDEENEANMLRSICIRYCLHVLDQAAMRRLSLEASLFGT